jgi:hypothetical protein
MLLTKNGNAHDDQNSGAPLVGVKDDPVKLCNPQTGFAAISTQETTNH